MDGEFLHLNISIVIPVYLSAMFLYCSTVLHVNIFFSTTFNKRRLSVFKSGGWQVITASVAIQLNLSIIVNVSVVFCMIITGRFGTH